MEDEMTLIWDMWKREQIGNSVLKSLNYHQHDDPFMMKIFMNFMITRFA